MTHEDRVDQIAQSAGAIAPNISADSARNCRHLTIFLRRQFEPRAGAQRVAAPVE